jgi:choline dehydrogenase-like flavoprotein
LRFSPACISCGWCGSGCPTEAKATAANTYLAKAEQLGARVISEAFVHRVNYDSAKNRVTGVEYLDAERREHRIKAKVVVLAAHAIEMPRLLLLSAHRAFPEGLANSSGLVGKNFMSHPTWQVFGTFDEPVNAFKGMQMGHVMVQDYYRPDSRNGYARGFILLSYMMTPITFGNLSGLMFGQDYRTLSRKGTTRRSAWRPVCGRGTSEKPTRPPPRSTPARCG